MSISIVVYKSRAFYQFCFYLVGCFTHNYGSFAFRTFHYYRSQCGNFWLHERDSCLNLDCTNRKIFGLGGTEPFEGLVIVNVLLVISTLIFLFTYPVLVKISFAPPGTLVVIVILSYLSFVLDLPVGMVSVSGDFGDFHSLSDFVKRSGPANGLLG